MLGRSGFHVCHGEAVVGSGGTRGVHVNGCLRVMLSVAKQSGVFPRRFLHTVPNESRVSPAERFNATTSGVLAGQWASAGLVNRAAVSEIPHLNENRKNT